jgi:tetratricopeptide (TPR) repeat protein
VGWALIALVPTHTLLARADVVTDRSLHLAWVGPAIGIGALLGRFVRTGRSPQVRVLLASAALAFAVLATRAVHRRVEVWSDPRALWTEAIRHSPGSARAWNNLGLVLLERDPREAARALRRAAELSPADPQLLSTLAVLETLCPTEGPCR